MNDRPAGPGGASVSGLGKIGAYSATAGYMSAMGVPGQLLPAVILTEVLGAIAIVIGWRTKIVAALLAGFTLLSALIFHNNVADQVQAMLIANGAGAFSLDRRAGR